MADYEAPSDYPQPVPLLTGVLAELVARQAQDEGRRPTAFPTLMRYSDAGGCQRRIALDALLPEDEGGEVDVASEFRMWIGSLLHSHVQRALLAAHGGQCESATFLGATHTPGVPEFKEQALVAGHSDWCGYIKGTDLGRVCYELKTVGAFAFDQSIGLKRKTYSRSHPQGPKASAKIQGALNAVANDCDTLIIGSISMEAVSIQLAEAVGLSNLDRIVAEWHYPRAEFEVWAKEEMRRVELIDGWLKEGILPPRVAVGDEMQTVNLVPEDRPPWQCVYCRRRETCVALGPGAVPIDRVKGQS